MPLRTLVSIALISLAFVQLTHSVGVDGSHTSLDAFDESGVADDAITPSPRGRHDVSPEVDMNSPRREGSMLSHIPRPPPVLTRRPNSGVLRMREPQMQAPPAHDVKMEPPQPHPMLANLRAQAKPEGPESHSVLGPMHDQVLDRGKNKMRRSREDEDDVMSAQQRAEAARRRRMLLRSDSAGRARKMRHIDEGSSRPFAEQPSLPLGQRADVPTRQPVILEGIPITDQFAAHAQQGAPANLAPDTYLNHLFQSYHSFPQSGLAPQGPTFDFHGLRYGHFPATEPLADPPAFHSGDPHAGAASVLRPADVRWTFGQVEQRRMATLMAHNNQNTVAIRKTMADEAARLYRMEADKIREEIETHSRLPLDTSEDWRNWMGKEGANTLLYRIANFGLPKAAVTGRERLALGLYGSDLSKLTTIPLYNEHEKWAANLLVAWWTNNIDQALRVGLH